ncbi:penicillin-binding transpeptidase domain-containing protein [Salisediminibacterium halotolerans]|uniref:penicillin-binding transpeptidase domain-containing protein n=1 Tax=Salisediminibacterium halotolerans TaxID=517425 RepID=UPI000EB45049|nr:penicillin-binding transpeptidase domain-containing protein [Salisediminibacterium halotolerans]RLJ75609.1 penicillin-binding protein [Actinophytocola xinjiangensis]RPE89463.1 penicillin-binding protein [Salisediminibacterium halotolerans]TWG36222.1 penicillin-binding protein [Salisediminibacterium halotolerans]GEL08503.1 penicillin-binding protein 3 [Salisediminibacterium halotolerans]
MIKRIMWFLAAAVMLAGCSSEEPEHPEDALQAYLDSWEAQDGAQMYEQMTEASQETVDGAEWDFAERYEEVYDELLIEMTELSFDEGFFEEHEIDAEETESFDIPVEVAMDTIVGEITYTLAVNMQRQTEETEDGEVISWRIAWEPDHFMPGMEAVTDTVSYATESPERGEIYGSEGDPLAINGEVYQVSIVPDSTDDTDASAEEVAEILNIDDERAVEAANAYPDEPEWAAPVQMIGAEDERTDELLEVDGVLLESAEGREYPLSRDAAHLIGYIGNVTAEDLEEDEEGYYDAESAIGRSGLEAHFEEDLRGERGGTLSIMTENDEVREELGSEEAEAGEDFDLTIDSAMQTMVTDKVGEDSAAVVVMEQSTGELRTLVSQPSYDSSLRYLGLPDEQAEEYEETDLLFENRFQNVYSPGSVFKPLTAAIGLEEDLLDANEAVTIEGETWQPEDAGWGDYEVRRVNDSETEIDLDTAMKLSDNIYFAQLAREYGEETMTAWAEDFGFGENLATDYPLYTSQLVSDELDRDVLLADTGYGQGEILISPVHMTSLYSLFTNGGDWQLPGLTEEGEVNESVISEATASTVKESLASVVQAEDGTAYRDENGHDRELIGKTGTAELKSDSAEDGEQIGWYVSADAGNNDYIMTVMVQNAEDHGGSGYAVDLANEIWAEME